MKILIVSQYYYPERFVVTEIAEELKRLGNTVTVLTGKPNYGLNNIIDEYKKVKFECINGVDVHRVKLFPRKNTYTSVYFNYLSFFYNAKRFAKGLKDEYDVVLSFCLSPIISVSPAIAYCKKHKVPHVHYCMDLWPESPVITGAIKQTSLKYKILYKWSKSIYEKCNKIIISSPSFKEYFNDVLKIKKPLFKHIYQPTLSNKLEVKPYKFNSKTHLVYAGNIGTLQLIENLVDAIKLYNNKDVVLHVFGMGSRLEYLKQRIKDEQLEEQVIYEGTRCIYDLESYLYSADALIVPLKSNLYVGKTIPNKAIQFLKYGRPIIAIVKGDARDLLKKSKGVLLSEEDPNDIANKIDEIFKMNKSDRELFGKENLKLFDNNLSNEKLISQIQDVLTDSIK